MSSNSPQITLDDVAPILLGELSYGNTLPAKAFHKISYFVHESLQDHPELESDIEIFWYKYGTCVRTSNTQGVSIRKTGDSNEVIFHENQMESVLDSETDREVRDSVSDAVSMYYRLGLDGITDEQYEQAPHQIQRRYRALDQSIQGVIKGAGKETANFNRENLRQLQAEFTNSFPTNLYPHLRSPLLQTQSLISERLDNEDAAIGDIEEISDTFWTLFCFDLAAETATNVNPETVLKDLQVEDPEDRKRKLRQDLDRFEAEYLHVSKSGPLQTKAADALMASRLDCETVVSND